MTNIFIIGAGLSATSLIDYLLKYSQQHDWQVTVGDMSLATAQTKIADHPNGRAIQFNINQQKLRAREISQTDVVVSMLPGSLHSIVARECLKYGKHLLTPSYVSPEMQRIDGAVREKGLSFLNELGVDPGIDHMSAMRVIDRIKHRGGEILSFKSFCGGLVAPTSDDNPWNYKFSWNPRNVVVAGQGVAKYKENGQYKYVPYQKLFSTLSKVEVPGYGAFEVYPNRDSLPYCALYGLKDIPSIIRGTMRRPGYSEAWDIFVQLGCTDDSYVMRDSHLLSYRQYLESFLPFREGQSTEENLAEYFGLSMDSGVMDKLRWLGIFSDEVSGIKDATPAMVLQKILEQKWAMGPEDRDLLVMQHQFDFVLDGQKKRIISSMSCEGENKANTAMSYTVGTPLAIATKLLITGGIKQAGVHIPIMPEMYVPILDELESLGIRFVEEEIYL
ncbi:saccharopine dehydrogenase C-terminal domain-containing protein [Geopsychrobacter electrodiphilus]|uniref:saccharopine dehydrogenase C-terminal domain-containing protein n=1 Tax=Geopsychrobacter electrodiphilus TaxID=225196 RepID=UPI00035E9FC8|nr:saccharopine dehydrogenase C-terminal domain-containing protein [Geopsychrobacter electrodiphilus]